MVETTPTKEWVYAVTAAKAITKMSITEELYTTQQRLHSYIHNGAADFVCNDLYMFLYTVRFYHDILQG